MNSDDSPTPASARGNDEVDNLLARFTASTLASSASAELIAIVDDESESGDGARGPARVPVYDIEWWRETGRGRGAEEDAAQLAR